MPKYTVTVDGDKYPFRKLIYAPDYKFEGKPFEIWLNEWRSEIEGDDLAIIYRDGEAEISGHVKLIDAWEDDNGYGMRITCFTREYKHVQLEVDDRQYSTDPHNIIIDDIGSTLLNDYETDLYGSSIDMEFGQDDDKKFNRKEAAELVVGVTGFEIKANPAAQLYFKSAVGTDLSSSIRFEKRPGGLLLNWVKQHKVNKLKKRTKVVVYGAPDEYTGKYWGSSGSGTSIYKHDEPSLVNDDVCGKMAATIAADIVNDIETGAIRVLNTFSGHAFDVYDSIYVRDDRYGVAGSYKIYHMDVTVEAKSGKLIEERTIYYCNLTKLSANGRILLDDQDNWLADGQRVIRNLSRAPTYATAIYVPDKDVLSASDYAGKQIYAADEDLIYYSDGTNWVPEDVSKAWDDTEAPTRKLTHVPLSNSWFGHGGDGNETISVDTELTDPVKHYNNLTINSGKKLYAQGGLVIFVKGTLTLNGTIEVTPIPNSGGLRGECTGSGCEGAAGGDAGGALFVFAAVVAGTGTLQALGDAGDAAVTPNGTGGGAGDGEDGGDGLNGDWEGMVWPTSEGGGGATASPGAGGAGGERPPELAIKVAREIYNANLVGMKIFSAFGSGGAGGGGGYNGDGISHSNDGGGGGGGGGLGARGGDGGNGSSAAASTDNQAAGGGGGGGGPGGIVVLVTPDNNGTITGNVTGGAGGAGADGDSANDGHGGGGGGGGGGIIIAVSDVNMSTRTVTGGAGGAAGGAGAEAGDAGTNGKDYFFDYDDFLEAQ